MIIDELLEVYQNDGLTEEEAWQQIAEDAMEKRKERRGNTQ